MYMYLDFVCFSLSDWDGNKPVVRVSADGFRFSSRPQEEAVWHIFIWAVLSLRRDIAEHFLFETSCKIGKIMLHDCTGYMDMVVYMYPHCMFGLFDLHTMFPPGGALLACKLLRSIAELSEVWHENELVNDLNAAAE